MDSLPVSEFLNSKIRAGIFTGASVIFGRPNDKLLELHSGTLGRGFTVAITSNTLFDLQSITKAVVTAPLFLQAHQEKKVQLTDCVAKYLRPETVAKDSPLQRITFQQLLTHSSGLSDNDIAGDFASAEKLWKAIYAGKAYFEPGTAIEYTDLGFRILGEALEQIFGVDLLTAARERLWKPLGLQHITFNPSDKMMTAATPDAHGVIDDEQVQLLGGAVGCDGIFSNAEDLFVFMSKLLQDQSALQLFNANVAFPEQVGSSFLENLAVGTKTLGWEINNGDFNYSGPFQNPTCFEKAGGAGTFVWMDQQTKCILVYLTNYGKPKPFDEPGWNQLVSQVDPRGLSELLLAEL